jgi:hypothetical protein
MSRLSHLTGLSPETHGGFKRGETPLRQFQIHRATAKSRGIEFRLTFEEWEQWWRDSGHYHERGLHRGQYVMSRKGDIGAYELGNIDCVTTGENVAAAHTGKPKSEEWKQKVRKTKAARAASPKESVK